MKNCIVYLALLAAIGIGGCRPQRSITTSETRITDSVVVKVEQIKAPILSDRILIQEICDTITNEAVRFERVFVRDTDTVRVSVRDNALEVRIDQKERIISRLEERERTLKEALRESESTVRSRVNWKALVGALLLGFAIGYLRPWRWV